MGDGAKSLVYFVDTLEENPTPHFGILFEDGNILCFCCGGIIEPDDYEIIEDYKDFTYLDDTLKQFY